MGTRSSDLIAVVFVGMHFFPLIIASTGRLCSGLTSFVVTEAVGMVKKNGGDSAAILKNLY